MKFNAQKKRDLKTIFLQLDRDESGTIEPEEIVTLLIQENGLDGDEAY